MLFRLLNVFRFQWVGKLMIFLVDASARGKTPFEKVARVIVDRVFTVPKHDNFMADDYVDNDQGYDLEELRRYQRGE